MVEDENEIIECDDIEDSEEVVVLEEKLKVTPKSQQVDVRRKIEDILAERDYKKKYEDPFEDWNR
jgi:hypothetical protein